VVGDGAPGGATVAAATVATGKVPEKVALRGMIDDLSSGDVVKRGAAEKMLAGLGLDRRGDLRVELERMLLPEVEQKVQARLAAMDREMALNPPPISLHVHGGDINAVAAELAMATGTDLGGYTGPFPSGQYTCDVDNKLFWEVVAPLNQQSGLIMFTSSNRYMLASAGPNTGMEHYDIKGPFIVYASQVTSDYVQLTLAADPRTPLRGHQLRYAVVDTEGKVFEFPDTRPAAIADRMMPVMDRYLQRASVSLLRFHQASPGGTVAAIRVHAKLGIAMKTASLEIKDIEKNLNQPQSVGGATVTLTQFELRSPKGYGFNFTCKRENEQMFSAYELINANGAVFFSGNSLGGGGVGSSADAGPGPYTFRVNVVEELKTVNEEFELKL